jgi:hypothetical protein
MHNPLDARDRKNLVIHGVNEHSRCGCKSNFKQTLLQAFVKLNEDVDRRDLRNRHDKNGFAENAAAGSAGGLQSTDTKIGFKT